MIQSIIKCSFVYYYFYYYVIYGIYLHQAKLGLFDIFHTNKQICFYQGNFHLVFKNKYNKNKKTKSSDFYVPHAINRIKQTFIISLRKNK